MDPTDEEPTSSLTAEQLRQAFRQHKDNWKVTEAMDRLGLHITEDDLAGILDLIGRRRGRDMKFNVHSYLVLRVQHQGIEASSPQEAIRKAGDLLGAATPRFNAAAFGELATDAELTSEVESYLVDPLDEKGNVMYEKSTSYHPDGVTPHQPEGIVHAL